MAREFGTVGVIGLGTMGSGIAEVLARSNRSVVGVEVDDAGIERAREHLAGSTERAVAGGKLDPRERDGLLERITYTTDPADLAGAELVIEAVPEDLDLKIDMLAKVAALLDEDAVIATNTSSLSVTEIAVHTTRPGKVIGMHFFNPAPVLDLVEIVRTVVTEPEVVADVSALVDGVGKKGVVISDRAGFIANALLFGYLNHAVRMYEERYATREDLDAAMRLGAGYPMGPLALLDLIGLDTAYEILESMYSQSRKRLHAPAPLLKQMITAGLRGRKNGRGFYAYAAPDSPTIVAGFAAPARPAWHGSAREIRRVGVIGTGTMATGIAEVFAKTGYEVVLRGRSRAKADAGVERVRASLQRAVVKGKLAEPEREEVLGRITPTGDFAALAEVDLAVEAVAEDLEVKRAVFASLDEVCRSGAVLATTTSSLPVVECAAATGRPADVLGLHFFNPAPVMKLVEVVATISTVADVLATGHAVCEATGKHPVHCRDRAGFIVNALLFPYLNDAVGMLEAHYAEVGDIDTAMKVGCHLPMGPFELLDVVGLDVALAIQRALFEEFSEAGFAPAPLLEHLVTAGRLGRKTGKGIHAYS